MKNVYKKIFFDTAPIIYLLEKKTEHYANIVSLLKACKTSMLVSSAITVMEYLTYPYRVGDTDSVNDFFDFLADYNFTILPIDESVAGKAAKIRADSRIRSMDALQLAAAIQCGCDVFLTNDRRLRQFKAVPVLLVGGLQTS